MEYTIMDIMRYQISHTNLQSDNLPYGVEPLFDVSMFYIWIIIQNSYLIFIL